MHQEQHSAHASRQRKINTNKEHNTTNNIKHNDVANVITKHLEHYVKRLHIHDITRIAFRRFNADHFLDDSQSIIDMSLFFFVRAAFVMQFSYAKFQLKKYR